MNAEIITSGTELLLGDTIDTNSAYIARGLRDIGVNLYFKTSVGDNIDRMAQILCLGLERSDVIITTGGLGPTVDDVTREAVAQATGCELVLYPECMAAIEAIFARWGRPVGANNRRQAYLPQGSIPITNPVGTAPGFILENGSGTIIALPGVPREMERQMQDTVLPYLLKRMGNETAVIKARVLKTAALGESWIDERIEHEMRSANPTVGLAAHLGVVDIRIAARATDVDAADRMIAEMEVQIRRRLGEDSIFGSGSDTLEGVTAAVLARAGVKLAVVETATGGELARMLMSTPDGPRVVTRALVVDTADNFADRLGLSRAKVEAYDLVSQMVAGEAAATLIDTYEGGWGLALVGGTDGDQDIYGENPGRSFVALGTPSEMVVREYPYGGSAFLARKWVVLRALDLLRRQALARLREREKR